MDENSNQQTNKDVSNLLDMDLSRSHLPEVNTNPPAPEVESPELIDFAEDLSAEYNTPNSSNTSFSFNLNLEKHEKAAPSCSYNTKRNISAISQKTPSPMNSIKRPNTNTSTSNHYENLNTLVNAATGCTINNTNITMNNSYTAPINQTQINPNNIRVAPCQDSFNLNQEDPISSLNEAFRLILKANNNANNLINFAVNQCQIILTKVPGYFEKRYTHLNNKSEINDLNRVLDGHVVPDLNYLKTNLNHTIDRVNAMTKKLNDNLVSNGNANYPSQNRGKIIQKKPPDKSGLHNKLDNLIIINKLSFNNYRAPLIKEMLINHPDIIGGKFKVSFFNVHINDSIYIHCVNRQSKIGISNILLNAGYSSRGVKYKQNFVKFSAILNNIQPDYFVKRICQSNSFLNNCEKSFTFDNSITISKTKKKLTFKVDKDTHSKLMENRIITFELGDLTVENFRPLLQCFGCSCYGHSIKFCSLMRKRNPILVCPNCAENHTLKSCPLKNLPINDTRFKCGNCKRKNLEFDHPSFSKVCPIRKKYLENLISFRSREYYG